MNELYKKLGHSFNNNELLLTALTHSSFANENKDHKCAYYERLEFLGDSILGYTVAEYLYKSFPDMHEGAMTKLRAEMVCEQSLFEVSKKLEIGKYMRLGKGEEHTGGRERPSILADMVEAVIAAVYLDGGEQKAKNIIYKYILEPYSKGVYREVRDYKTELQEIAQKDGPCDINYEIVREDGPAHCRIFTTRVMVNSTEAGQGSGKTKKESEQMAAKCAVENFGAK